MINPTAAEIERACARLVEAREQLLRLTTKEIIAAVDASASRLLDDAEPIRGEVLRSLTDVSGFSAPMAAHILDRVCRDWLAPALERLVHAEFAGAAPLDGFASAAPGSPLVRVLGPPLGFHVFSGNVPGVAVTSIVRALLVRSAVLGKAASGEPALPAAFVRLLREMSPVVGAAVEVMYWPGGDREREAAALRHASLVVHYGSADAVEDLRARAHARIAFIEHGPRLSFAVVKGNSLASARRTSDAARDMAQAVALFDQQGCVSPQLVWIIGDEATARAFAAATAAALEELELELPRGRIDAGEAGAIRALRTRAEFSSADQTVWGPDELSWTVILSRDPRLEGSCLNRTLIVKYARDLDDVVRAIEPFSEMLQTVGVHGFENDERLRVADALALAGATRITSIADMPWPPPEWHHDGRGPLRELVRWIDYEPAPASQSGS